MRWTAKPLALAITLYFVILAVNYARVTPPFESPDEAAHFLYVHNLLEDGDLTRLVSRAEFSGQAEPTRQWALESHQPPLYYAIGAGLVFWLDRSDIEDFLRTNDLIFSVGITDDNHNQWLHNPTRGSGDTGLAIWILRGYSMGLGAATLWFVYLAAREAFDSAAVALASMFLVASIPTYIAISASVNNDNLATTLYAAGVYWTLRIFKRHEIKNRDIVVLSVILGLISIAKLTGLSLYGIVYPGLVVGVRRGHFTWGRTLRLVGWSMAAFVIIAGWWYARNLRLYDDPFALDATANLWGRQFEISPTSGNIGEELLRIGKSFWMMFGHLHNPVQRPDWLYIYAAIATAIGIFGVGATFKRSPEKRDVLMLMTAVCVVVSAMLLAGTRTVDISYGRLLFPALVGFAPLMIVGWRRLLGRYVSAALIVPFSVMALIAPMRELPEGYPRLAAVDALPAEATPLNVAAGDLAFVAYDMDDTVVEPGERLTFDLYIRGRNSANPYVSATLVDPITFERMGYTAIYPGIAPTEALDPDQLYRVKVWIEVDEELETALRPRQLRLRLAWRDPGAFRDLRLMNDAGFDSDAILVDAATLLDKRYESPAPEYAVDAEWESIALEGYTLSDVKFSPGETLTATFVWDAIRSMDDNWLYTVQLFSADGDFITQADGIPEGYPTTAWIVNQHFADSRMLTIPEDTPPGDYGLDIGWYRIAGEDEFVRMAIDHEGAENDLFALPQMITVAGS